ncbi:uncharacterized protein LOC126674198 isoform X2 [Mercurialis annua]|uniref:uncharacterized protein LOC126674198 isoform X2 n=1 Tax=Mercurialis annua TaxID=3986 RepID=UPI00215FF80F|nr:uncharacterized protein LOC126674198 isoform X2 [Mercurialis annua]
MNPYNYMDKQITEFSNPKTTPTLFNYDEHLKQPHDEDDQDYDQDHTFRFHPFRSPTKPLDTSHLSDWSSMDHMDSTKRTGDRVGIFCDEGLISRIDQILKEQTDVLLHSVEYLSARVTQMESRVRQVENSFDGLKESIEFNHGKTDGKLRELENILIEVHGGIKDLRDKQEIAETQVQLAKLQASKGGPEMVDQYTSVQPNLSRETLSSVPQQYNQPPAIPVVSPQPELAFSYNMTNLPPQNHPPPAPTATAQVAAASAYIHTAAATAPHLPSQFPQNITPFVSQQESYYPQGTGHQQLAPPMHQSQQQSLHPYQPYQPPHLPLNSHLTQLPQVQPPLTIVDPRANKYYPEELPYASSPGTHNSAQPHDRPRPAQAFNIGSTQRAYNHPSNVFDSESTANLRGQGLQQRGYGNTLDYHRSPPSHSSSSNTNSLPTARTLPHAIPTASTVDSGSSPRGTGSRVAVDDVVDQVVAMGFRRDTVRATVKKLTENGQSVDLNAVLDKVMNNG